MAYQRLLVSFLLLSSGAFAQWVRYVPPGTPKTKDGKPNLTAPTPRTASGKPDLSGVWMHELTSVAEMRRLFGGVIDEAIKVDVPGMEIGTQHKYIGNILLDYKAEEVSLTAAGAEEMRRRQANDNPAAGCSGVPGLPVVDLLSEPIKIVQAPKMTIMLYEVGNLYRQIYADGRALPKEYDLPSYLGYSVGRWESDTFVVETAGFNDKTPLDLPGHPHSDSLRMTERYRRRDFGHLDVEYTFNDPKMYTKPFTIKVPHNLMPDGDIFESLCENEKDARHIEAAISGKK